MFIGVYKGLIEYEWHVVSAYFILNPFKSSYGSFKFWM